MERLAGIKTEQRNAGTVDIDRVSTLEMVRLMNTEDKKVAEAVEAVLPKVAEAVDLIYRQMSQGGRLVYCGSGTSGRLGVLDAAECPPTFGVSPDVVIGLIAGGDKAFIKAVEGAEDSVELGREDLVSRNLTEKDLVIGIAASGRTPYVLGGLACAKEVGCHTVAISCNKDCAIGKAAELAIEVVVGPEVLTGSTRLKAGTAQKLVLNMISTATMVGVGKAYHNLMVDVMQTNEKLHRRAEKIVMEATGVTQETAKDTIAAAEGSVKTAITMILADCSAGEARARLEKARGHVREAIK